MCFKVSSCLGRQGHPQTEQDRGVKAFKEDAGDPSWEAPGRSPRVSISIWEGGRIGHRTEASGCFGGSSRRGLASKKGLAFSQFVGPAHNLL